MTIAAQKQSYDQWLHGQPNSKEGLTSDQFIQHLHLSSSPNATAQIRILVPTSEVTSNLTDTQLSSNLQQWYQRYTSSKHSGIYSFTQSIPGDVMQITYTNLSSGNTYIDNAGVTHIISKIVRTISNLGTDRGYYLAESPSVGRTHLQWFNNPIDGVQYTGNVTIHDDYYDENGQKIDIKDHAYITLSSLNNTGYGANKDNFHVEKATTPSGKVYSLIGSTVSVHNDGWAYSDKNNSEAEYSGKAATDWDNSSSPDFYYGAAVADAADRGGTTVSFMYTVQPSRTPAACQAWSTVDTVIPQTPNPRTTIHYHYNTK